MTSTSLDLEKGREAFHRGSWTAAHAALSRSRTALPAADLSRLAMASYLLGREDEFVSTSQDAHQAHLDQGEPLAAARCAF